MHQGLKITAILLKGWILSIGEASAVEGLRSTRLPRLVFPQWAKKAPALPKVEALPFGLESIGSLYFTLFDTIAIH